MSIDSITHHAVQKASNRRTLHDVMEEQTELLRTLGDVIERLRVRIDPLLLPELLEAPTLAELLKEPRNISDLSERANEMCRGLHEHIESLEAIMKRVDL